MYILLGIVALQDIGTPVSDALSFWLHVTIAAVGTLQTVALAYIAYLRARDVSERRKGGKK